MILSKIFMNNFGVFKGKHEIDVSNSADGCPIVLIGGKNGTGKTTLHESVRLSLLGKLALGERISQSQYEEHLLSRIHRYNDSLVDISSASVGLKFGYSQGGRHDIYIVKRRWRAEDGGIVEFLSIEKNGERLKGARKKDELEDFLRNLVPFELTDLFFFDGQKIEKLSKNIWLGEVIKSLLGLDVVNRLRSDLDIYMARRNGGENPNLQSKIEAAHEERKAGYERIKELEERRDQMFEKLGEVEEKIQRNEENFAREGGSFAKRRDELKARKVRLETQNGEIENRIKNICEGPLPFALAPALCHQLKLQLEREEKYQQYKAFKKLLKRKLNEVRSKVSSPSFWKGTKVSDKSRKEIADRFVSAFELSASDESLERIQPVHLLSQSKGRELRGWLDESLTKAPSEIGELDTKLEVIKSNLEDLEENLQKVPDDESIRPIFEKLRDLEKRKFSLENQIREAESEIDREKSRSIDVDRRIDKLREELVRRKGASKRAKMAKRAGDTLKDYSEKLTEMKLGELCKTLPRYFNRLSKKTCLDKVEIDLEDFSVKMTEDGRIIPYDELSRGEKQIYTISFLWALKKISGAPLPVMIDAPLNPLDEDHRDSVVENYFPCVSRQVLLMSTDTEINRDYLEKLRPAIARIYRLDYNKDEKCTRIAEGYFW